jgi:hypothetical protein
MSRSTVPLVRAALFTRFTDLLAAAGDTATKVTYGHPGQQIPQRYVSVSSTDDGITRDQKTIPLRAASSRTETYGLTVVLWNLTGTQSSAGQRQMVEDCWATFDVLDTGLREETTLGGLVTWALFTRAVDDDFLLNEGRAAQIVATVTVNLNRA